MPATISTAAQLLFVARNLERIGDHATNVAEMVYYAATGAYLTEVRVPESSKCVGLTLSEIEKQLEDAGAQVVGLVRHEMRVNAPSPYRRVLAGDILGIVPPNTQGAGAPPSLPFPASDTRTQADTFGGAEQQQIVAAEAGPGREG